MIIFHNYEHSFLPSSLIKLKKKRTIGYATTFDTVIIFCNPNISHSFTCPKPWGKELKRIKTLKMFIFHNSEHSFLPTSLIKLNKNNWARNYMCHFYYFM